MRELVEMAAKGQVKSHIGRVAKLSELPQVFDDLEAARAAGVTPVLVRTGKGARNEPRLAGAGLGDVQVLDSLVDLVDALPEVTG